MNIVQRFTTSNPCYKKQTRIHIAGIVLHSTGTPQPDANSYFAAFNSPIATKAVHAFIQQDGYILQTLPWDIKAWHCGGQYNNDHIGIEMTEPSTIKYTGGSKWTDLDPDKTKKHVLNTYKYAVELCAKLCSTYKLNPLGDGVIVSHHEAHLRGKASGHNDVEHIWNKLGLTMNKFRQDVKNTMTGSSTTPTPPKTILGRGTIYQVNITDKNSKLNVRDVPEGTVVGELGYNQLAVILATDNGWGKLSTGGWVKMEYMKKFVNGFQYTPRRALIYVKVDNLNIRSTPEVKIGNVTGTLSKGKKYTIVATCNGFGLLLSSAGNVSINPEYVTITDL